MNILAIQISDRLINPNPDKYLNQVYKTFKPFGYYRNKHFLELPLWIAELSGLFKYTSINLDKYILTDLRADLRAIESKVYDYILFSVMDCNKAHILEFIKTYTGTAKFIIGGYCNLKTFKRFKNVIIKNNIQDLADYLNVSYKYSLNYSLFRNYKTIPRLTLSTGCKYRCKFCTVPDDIKELSFRDVLKQVDSFKPLKFKLIYLDDKTFFQANNLYWLSWVYNRVKKYNPNFEGFIIQSQVNTINNFRYFNGILEYLNIKVIELGIESYNNVVLKQVNKPQTIQSIKKCIEFLKHKDVKIIPNIMIGLPKENKSTYNKTLSFLNDYKNDLFFMNIFNIAIYNNTPLHKDIKIKNKNDYNEAIINKSFHSNTENINAIEFSNKLYKIAYKMIAYNSISV